MTRVSRNLRLTKEEYLQYYSWN